MGSGSIPTYLFCAFIANRTLRLWSFYCPSPGYAARSNIPFTIRNVTACPSTPPDSLSMVAYDAGLLPIALLLSIFSPDVELPPCNGLFISAVDPAFAVSPYGGLPTCSFPAHRGSGEAVVHFPQYVKLLVAHGADSTYRQASLPAHSSLSAPVYHAQHFLGSCSYGCKCTNVSITHKYFHAFFTGNLSLSTSKAMRMSNRKMVKDMGPMIRYTHISHLHSVAAARKIADREMVSPIIKYISPMSRT